MDYHSLNVIREIEERQRCKKIIDIFYILFLVLLMLGHISQIIIGALYLNQFVCGYIIRFTLSILLIGIMGFVFFVLFFTHNLYGSPKFIHMICLLANTALTFVSAVSFSYSCYDEMPVILKFIGYFTFTTQFIKACLFINRKH